MGGIAGALASHADAWSRSMSAARRSSTRAIFLRLVTPERTRAIVGSTSSHSCRPTSAEV